MKISLLPSSLPGTVSLLIVAPPFLVQGAVTDAMDDHHLKQQRLGHDGNHINMMRGIGRHLHEKGYKGGKDGKSNKQESPDESTYRSELDDDVDQLKDLYDQMGKGRYWKANEVMQYQVADGFAMIPPFAQEDGFVESVPHVPAEEEEEFSAVYLNRTKRDFRKDPIKVEEARDCQFNRLNWVQDNTDVFVNQLRLSGFGDDRITNLFRGDPPMGWANRSLYNQFKEELCNRAKPCLAADTVMRNIAFVFSGSSASGYSTNPYKGGCDFPTWMTSLKSDLDVGIVADDAVLEAMKKPTSYLRFSGTVDRETASGRFIVGTKRADDDNGGGEGGDSGGHYNGYYEDTTPPTKAPTPSSNNDEGNDTMFDRRHLQRPAYPGYQRLYDIFGDCFGNFWRKWENNTDGPIQFYLQENKYRIPGWELTITSCQDDE